MSYLTTLFRSSLSNVYFLTFCVFFLSSKIIDFFPGSVSRLETKCSPIGPIVLKLNTFNLNCFSSEKCFTTVYFVLIRTILIPVVVWFERAGFVEAHVARLVIAQFRQMGIQRRQV